MYLYIMCYYPSVTVVIVDDIEAITKLAYLL